jgi:hypothetical protein
VQVVLPTLNDSKAEHTTSTVEDVRVGSTKKTPDTVGDHEVAVNGVIESFGGFLKILSCTVNGIYLPPARDTVQGVTATRSIQILRDALWYVKESHLTLSERGCTISPLFRQFNGYNKPEQQKHRKWIPSSLSGEVLLQGHRTCLGYGIHLGYEQKRKIQVYLSCPKRWGHAAAIWVVRIRRAALLENCFSIKLLSLSLSLSPLVLILVIWLSYWLSDYRLKTINQTKKK